MVSTNLAIPEVSSAQSQKEVTMNAAVDDLDVATQSQLSKVSTGDITLTADEYTRNFVIKITGTPGVPFDLNTPATSRFLLVHNTADDIATVQVTGGGGTGVDVATGEARLIYCDGTDMLQAGGGGTAASSYDFGAQFGTEPVITTIFGRVMIPRAITLPANLAGSTGAVDTNPTSSYVIDVQDDGVSIATITISTGGAFTFVTDGGTLKNVAAGSMITFISPGSLDTTVAGMAVAFLATED